MCGRRFLPGGEKFLPFYGQSKRFQSQLQENLTDVTYSEGCLKKYGACCHIYVTSLGKNGQFPPRISRKQTKNQQDAVLRKQLGELYFTSQISEQTGRTASLHLGSGAGKVVCSREKGKARTSGESEADTVCCIRVLPLKKKSREHPPVSITELSTGRGSVSPVPPQHSSSSHSAGCARLRLLELGAPGSGLA